MLVLGGVRAHHQSLELLPTHWDGLERVEAPPHEVIHTFLEVCKEAEEGRGGEGRGGEEGRGEGGEERERGGGGGGGEGGY